MTLRHKVLVSAVTPTGPEPQFFGTFVRLADARDFAEIFSQLEDEGSATVTVTHEITPRDPKSNEVGE